MTTPITYALFEKAERDVYTLMSADSLGRFLQSKLFAAYENEYGSTELRVIRRVAAVPSSSPVLPAAAAAAAAAALSASPVPSRP